MGHLAASVGKGRSPQVNEDSSFSSLIVSKEVFHFEGKALFRADHSVAHRRSDATKTFMTSKTMTVA